MEPRELIVIIGLFQQQRPKSVMIKRRSVEINNDSSNVSNTSEDSTGSVQMPQSTLYDDSYGNRSTTTTTRRDQSKPGADSSVNTSADRQANEGDYSSEANSTGSRLIPNDVQLVDEPESKRHSERHSPKRWFKI